MPCSKRLYGSETLYSYSNTRIIATILSQNSALHVVYTQYITCMYTYRTSHAGHAILKQKLIETDTNHTHYILFTRNSCSLHYNHRYFNESIYATMIAADKPHPHINNDSACTQNANRINSTCSNIVLSWRWWYGNWNSCNLV